ncbi:bifunctional metallophosphatase/5'-nucleotidase [Granulicella sibirica]|uniref:bifunctional metallophosphatase/5'-nucleotidase n=1 Tax=Granulicella sibirica TaxID=2479048 RepID=UPI001375A363|nr:bifunctional metallophosphatase/5'-nucleotidase [Granulicella sibirica]
MTVQVLAINDLHGNLEPPVGRDGMVGKTPAGGAEYLATHLKMAEAEEPNSIVVGAGDLMGASPLISALFDEEPAIEAINAMGLKVTSIGNHEMDHGITELKRRLKTAHYQYLAANVLENGTPVFPATSIQTVGGVKIGFIGETLEGSAAVISASAIRGDQFLEESQVANEAALQLEKAGVHAIVLLIHQGGAQHGQADAMDRDSCANFSGEIQGIVERLSPAIQLVISGHTHEYYNCRIAGHTVTSAGAYGRLFTRVKLTVDRRTDRILTVAAANEIVTRDVPRDPAQTAILEKYKPRAEEVANRTVGSIAGEISRKQNAAGESAMGDVIADAQLTSVAAKENGGAELAFMNTGGIRAELPATGPGEVSFGELYAVQPFGNQITVLTMTGEDIRQLLEEQFRSDGSSIMLQVSEGFNYQYRLHAAPGEHVVPGSIKLRGKVLGAKDRVRVEANGFMVAGAEGMTAFKSGTDKVIGTRDVDALVAYFKTHSPVEAPKLNRIVRLD